MRISVSVVTLACPLHACPCYHLFAGFPVEGHIYTETMASIAMIAGAAILNAAAFTGGNYLAKYLSGDGGQAALDEKIRHDKALKKY